MWSPCGVYVESMWSPCGVHVESMWTPLECMWNSGRVLLISCGLHVDSMWSSCGVHRSTNQKCDFLVLHVESIWSPVESMWSRGVHMDSMEECKVHEDCHESHCLCRKVK